MPYLNLKVAGEASAARSTALATVLTDLTVEFLKKKREVTSVAAEFLAQEQWFIGGHSLKDQPGQTFFLDIKVTESTNTKDEKAAFIAQVFTSMEGILGEVSPASCIVIHEVHADAWGYQGQTQELRYIKGKAL